MAGITNITFTNASIQPAFDTSINNYSGIISNSNFTIIYSIEATTVNPLVVEVSYLNTTETHNHASNGTVSIPVSTMEPGTNNLTIKIYPQLDPTHYALYTFSLTLNISNNNKYPVYEHFLNPGYYGGTYIPTYRKIWEFYPVGNDPNWYPDADYDIKSYQNQKVMDEISQSINDAVYSGQGDAIVEMFCHYSGFINTVWPNTGDSVQAYDYRFYLPIIMVGVNRPNKLQGNYIPKNNKLYCYPYASMELQGYGQNQELKYEDFDNKTSTLKYLGIVSKFLPGATIMLYPFNYNGIEDNFDYGVCGNELPVLPYTIDKYLNEYHASRNTRTQNMAALIQSEGYKMATAWMGGAASGAGNINKTITPGTEVPIYHGNPADFRGMGNMGFTNSNMNAPIYQDAFTGGSGVFEGGKVSYGGNTMVGAANALASTAKQIGASLLTIHQGYAALAAELADTQNRPAVISNQNAAPSIPIAIKEGACPYVVFKSIRKEIAQRIDTFFTRFGYRTNRMGTPNIYKRPYFTFLKCHNAIIGGNIPAEDKEALKVIFQKGVTFWHTSQDGFTSVGDYDHLSDLNLAAIR